MACCHASVAVLPGCDYAQRRRGAAHSRTCGAARRVRLESAHASACGYRRLFRGRRGAVLPHAVPGGRALFGVHDASRGLRAHPRAARLHESTSAGDDWAGVGELMLYSSRKLARAGADFLICPDNTIHEALPGHPRALTAALALHRGGRGRGGRSGAVTGGWGSPARVSCRERGLSAEALVPRHLQYQRPHRGGARGINRIILEELVRGVYQTRRGGLPAGRLPPHAPRRAATPWCSGARRSRC